MLDVFGDESAGGDFVSYALACIPAGDAAQLGDDIERLKARHSLDKLHCRILFSGDQRAKKGLAHLTTPAVIGIYEELADVLLTAADLRIVTARGRLSDFPNAQPADGDFPRVVFDSKTMGIFCANCAIIPMLRDYRGGGEIRIWPDDDPTKAEWLGKRMKASSAVGGYFNVPGVNIDDRVNSNPLSEMPNDARRALFEVADLAAWLSNRLMTGRGSNLYGRLVALHRRLAIMEVSVYGGNDGGLSCNVPEVWPDRLSRGSTEP